MLRVLKWIWASFALIITGIVLYLGFIGIGGDSKPVVKSMKLNEFLQAGKTNGF